MHIVRSRDEIDGIEVGFGRNEMEEWTKEF